MRSYWEEDLAILSAENVAVSVETSGLGSRMAALCIDTTLQLLVLLLLYLGWWGASYYIPALNSMPAWVQSTAQALYVIFLFFLFFGYYFLFEWLWDGQTPGKRYLGMRVTMANGLPLSMWPALVRNTVRLVDFLPFFYGIGAVVSMANLLNQRAGDMAAGTIVVREGRREKANKPLSMREAVDKFLEAAQHVPVGLPADARDWHAEELSGLSVEAIRQIDPEALALAKKLNREDYELARDFVTRRDAMPRDTRLRLGRALAIRLSEKSEMPLDINAPEPFIEGVIVTLSRVYSGV
ncbi:RDD family protein [bacterium]|nr:MAG: RDD family protein [bacterium]